MKFRLFIEWMWKCVQNTSMQITIRNYAVAAADKKSHSRFVLLLLPLKMLTALCVMLFFFFFSSWDDVPLNKFLGQLGSDRIERRKNNAHISGCRGIITATATAPIKFNQRKRDRVKKVLGFLIMEKAAYGITFAIMYSWCIPGLSLTTSPIFFLFVPNSNVRTLHCLAFEHTERGMANVAGWHCEMNFYFWTNKYTYLYIYFCRSLSFAAHIFEVN